MNIDVEFWGTIMVLVTGIGCLIDHIFFKADRKQKLADYRAQVPAGIDAKDQKLAETKIMEPVFPFWICESLFPVFLIVLLIRSFLVEPFTIPSSSMEPTLYPGDFVLVNKFTYGVRLPVLRTEILELGSPKRGDVLVFRYPLDEKTNYIKRVMGVPGDEITYTADKRVLINGQEVALEEITYPKRTPFKEGLAQMPQGENVAAPNAIYPHSIRLDQNISAMAHGIVLPKTWQVKDDEYFVLGDNRDHSQDSRYWGMVPDRLVVGKAFALWMHMPQWIPQFHRNGWIQ